MQSELQFEGALEITAQQSRRCKSVARTTFRKTNRLRAEDESVHDWYRFVLSYPPHLVRKYLDSFKVGRDCCVLDPFCGTGTTLVECKKLGIQSIGIEANRMAWFASDVKTDWMVDPEVLLKEARNIAQKALRILMAEGIHDVAGPLLSAKLPCLRTLAPELNKLLLGDSISPLPLHKTLVLLDVIEQEGSDFLHKYEKLALAKGIVFGVSNLHFGPEVGVRNIKTDAPVITIWLEAVEKMCRDLGELKGERTGSTSIHCADSRDMDTLIPDSSIDAVITSPPYPNEKDYTRTTRLESVLLGFVRNKEDVRNLKHNLVRSNTRSVYKGDSDDRFVDDNEEVQQLAHEIEKRRIQLGKTSGFERMYPRLTKLYFGGMTRHLAGLRKKLRPGAQLAYVVGDQASYLRVMIRTGKLVADIARSLGYEVTGIDLFRVRPATVTKNELREEVVLLRWPA
jgi:hypothetical protein